jgi:hypothetical protein
MCFTWLGLGAFIPAGPGSLQAGWARSAAPRPPSVPNGPAGLCPGRASRPASALAWAVLASFPAGPTPWLGWRPGWAPSSFSPVGPAAFTRLGRIRRIRPGRDSSPSGLYLRNIPAGPGRDAPGPGRDSSWQAGILLGRPDYYLGGRISPLQGRYFPHWDIFLVQHRLQRIVPVLGRLQARTGTSSIVICWSWDAPWLRPAYPSSPSKSYPQEEDKTDDMVILKTDARRRRPRTPSIDIDGTSPRP